MFNNPIAPDRSIDEGVVIQVDPRRGVCRVKTINGQNLDSVQVMQPVGGSSRMGDRVCPALGDRVVLNHGLGYPVIVGSLPKIQVDHEVFPLQIDSGSELVDSGNYSPSKGDAYGDASKPKDMLAGDRVIASMGGSMLAILRGGSVILRGSRVAEIFMSRFGDLVKIVSRNWEHFTDVCSDVIRNVKGRVYRYAGYSNDFLLSKDEKYIYHVYTGDVALAEEVKTNYLFLPNPLPDKTDIIYKEQVTTAAEGFKEYMRRTLNEKGEEEVYITDPPDVGPDFTRKTSTAKELYFSWQDSSSITINEEHIELRIGDTVLELRADGTTLTTPKFEGIQS